MPVLRRHRQHPIMFVLFAVLSLLNLSYFKVQRQSQFVGGKRLRDQAVANLLQNTVQDKSQRLQALHRVFKLVAFNKIRRRFDGQQWPVDPPLGEFLQHETRLA